ncbi:hypothetical protein JCM3770_000519 [Rhodotorula araucariae]
MSALLSSLSGSLSGYLHRATGDAVDPFPARDQDDGNCIETPPSASPGTALRGPHTPQQRAAPRFSPNSLSASSATMSGVLTAHPHFSVFRKSASMQGFDDLAAAPEIDESPLADVAVRSSLSMRDLRDDDEVETLATPPNQSPRPRRASPRGARDGDKSGSSELSSFHLSLDSAELHSLNFGDQSCISLSPAGSPANALPVVKTPAATSPGQTSAVRIVPDSPPTARTPVPRSRSSSAQSSGKMRSSTGPVQRVQFSPISSCPSPLLSASTLPPPPPPPPAYPGAPSLLRASLGPTDENCPPLDDGRPTSGGTLSRPGSGILKHPRTPGTGRSVRFSASTAERTSIVISQEVCEHAAEDSPSAVAGSRSLRRVTSADEPSAASEQDAALVQAGVPTPNTLSVSTSREECEGNSSILVASFLSKLQAAIPSPDVSLVASPPPSAPVALPLIAVDPSTPGAPPALTLFDESNPFGGLTSALGASVLEQPNAAMAASLSAAQSITTLNASVSMSDVGAASNSATFLLQASLDGGAHTGAPTFGGNSFAELSTPYGRPLLPLQRRTLPLGLLEELSEEPESSRRTEVGAEDPPDASAATATSLATPRAPAALTAPLASAPAVPSPLRFETAGADSLMASDMSSVASVRDETLETHVTGNERRDAPGSPAPLIDFASPARVALVSPPGTVCTLVDAMPAPPTNSALVASTPPVAAATPSLPATNTGAAPATSSSSTSASFYRQFMAARARDGLSQSAREEWSRLERGEKASPKEGSAARRDEAEEEEVQDLTATDSMEVSVYYSPQKAWAVEEDEVDSGEMADAQSGLLHAFPGEAIAAAEDVEGEQSGDSSVVEHEGVRATFLSPVLEVSEPESNANTPLDEPVAVSSRSRAPPPTQPEFSTTFPSSRTTIFSAAAPPATPATPSSRALALARREPATPLSASKIPRPRNPITPSQNPFLLQLARTTTSSAQPQAASLLHDLFSAQQDQLATSSSQRFLLSSLVTNLQNEVEHKDVMIRNLKQQVGDARHELKEVEQLALAWEERALHTPPSGAARPPPSARKSSAALEETVQLLADELETRVREDRALRAELEAELDHARAELARRAHEARESEILLRHARESATLGEEERDALRREVERAEERSAVVTREGDELRARWAVDVDERERTIARLRDELQELKEAAAPGRSLDEADVDREVRRRVEAAQVDSLRDMQLVKHELVQRDAALADLREQLRAQRNESDRLARAVQEERQHAELAHADMAEVLSAKESELEHVLRDHDALQQDLDEVHTRLETAEVERDRLAAAARSKDEELAQQVAQCQKTFAAMADLEAAVVRIEAEAAAKDAQLVQMQKDFAAMRRESEDVLEKRDRVLAETERAAAKTRKELEAVQKENNRLSDLVGKLRRDSADREVKVTKLKKRAAELEEDVFGLNIALDAKQQEASHWKRQISSLKLEHERAAAAADATAVPSTVSRSAFAPLVPPSAASTAESTAKAARRTSASTRVHSTTPFPAEKQAKRTLALSRRSSSSSIARRASHAVDPAISTDDEAEHDLTLPPSAYEETPSRPAAAVGGNRKSASATQLGLGFGLPSVPRHSRAFAPEEKENAAPAPSRSREAVLA